MTTATEGLVLLLLPTAACAVPKTVGAVATLDAVVVVVVIVVIEVVVISVISNAISSVTEGLLAY